MRRAIFNIIGMALIAFGGMYLTTSPAMAADSDVCGQPYVDQCEERMDCCGDLSFCMFPGGKEGHEGHEHGLCWQ